MFCLKILVYFKSWNDLPMFSSKNFCFTIVYELIVVYDVTWKSFFHMNIHLIQYHLLKNNHFPTEYQWHFCHISNLVVNYFKLFWKIFRIQILKDKKKRSLNEYNNISSKVQSTYLEGTPFSFLVLYTQLSNTFLIKLRNFLLSE